LRLPPDDQAVVLLRHFDCLSFEEIGRRLDRSPDAARKLWGRAIVRLQHLMEVTRKATR
jgi:RNA polymerase sigma-70 factor, ECF subfamily